MKSRYNQSKSFRSGVAVPRVWLAVAGMMVLLAASIAHGATAADVRKSIERAKGYLYRTIANGHWEPRHAGETALVVHALLEAGERPKDPRLAPAIDYLLKTETRGTYVRGERLQVLGLLPRTPEVAAAIKRDVDALIASMGVGHIDGLYRYVSDGKPTTEFDLSCSNYGALGLWAAAETDYEVPTAAWQRIDAAWRKQQQARGGWSYMFVKGDTSPYSIPSVQLTAAGMATLQITQDYLSRLATPDPKRPKFVTEDPDIRQAMDWLLQNWKSYESIEGKRHYYGVYTIERMALASGRRFYGKIDWYNDGVDHLLKLQGPSGNFEGTGGDNINTAFAVIFLAHGVAPVALNKLEYERIAGSGKPTTQPVLWWHQRPRDAARFSKWLGKQAERKFSWQIVDLKHGPAVLHDAPILYITGEQAIRFGEEDEAVLRRYCEDGGLILANAENGSIAFTEFIKKLGSKLFPTYEFRELSPTHAIYTKQQFLFKDHAPAVKLAGLSNGSRELMVLIRSGDISRAWEMLQSKTKADCFEVPANIFHYAADRNNPRERGDSHIVLPDEKIETQRTIELARLTYNGNWNPEPGGWRRLAAILRNQEKIELACKTVTLGKGELNGMKLAHLTGTARLTLSDAAKEELKQFIAAGGVLIVDAAGGSAEFGDSIRPQLAAFVPGLDPLPAPLASDHALYKLTGHEIREFGYRRLAQDLPGGTPKGPRLRGIEVNGKPAIFYSEEDLSTALVGQQVGGMIGYAPETATAIVRNILLLAASGPAARP